MTPVEPLNVSVSVGKGSEDSPDEVWLDCLNPQILVSPVGVGCQRQHVVGIEATRLSESADRSSGS